MEPLLLAAICGCNAGLFREALREIYIPRIQRGDAFFAAKVLGARGALLSVLVHFFEHGRWSSPVETGGEGQSLTAEDQLYILMQAGLYLTATRGFAATEALFCYERAESLCDSLNRPLVLFSALRGLWRYSLATDKVSATMQIAKRVYALAQEQNDSALMMGAYRALACTLYFSGDFETALQYAIRGIQIWRSGRVHSPVEEITAPAVTCLCYEALSEWHFGEIASCHETMAEAISLAKDLNDMHALAMALWNAGILAHYERNLAEAERFVSDLIELSTRQNFAFFLAGGEVLRGWTRSASGDTSEALDAISEAEALVERCEERHWCAELHRLRGVFLATIGADEAQIEASLCAAITTAKRQKSISLATRADATYAEYSRQKPRALAGHGFQLPLC
jgi:tetratricopeptide (TPR) repeat protein